MNKDHELWRFVADELEHGRNVTLLVVGESSGSSPGRQGYKMAVGADGALSGSIGGGLMEVNLVERVRTLLSESSTSVPAQIIEQVHQQHSPNSSGMICSGRQTVILKMLTPRDQPTVAKIVGFMGEERPIAFEISDLKFDLTDASPGEARVHFSQSTEAGFVYRETIGKANELIIIGGGHCSLALSELASRLGFRISIFDDRPELNTLKKNKFADSVTIIASYESIADHLVDSGHAYVVVMTLGYASDAVVIRRLLDKDFKYFGVLGSKAKMGTLLKDLRCEGLDPKRLAQIRTPIGIPINSQTPEEIAVSIAAEMIAVRNGAKLP